MLAILTREWYRLVDSVVRAAFVVHCDSSIQLYMQMKYTSEDRIWVDDCFAYSWALLVVGVSSLLFLSPFWSGGSGSGDERSSRRHARSRDFATRASIVMLFFSFCALVVSASLNVFAGGA